MNRISYYMRAQIQRKGMFRFCAFLLVLCLFLLPVSGTAYAQDLWTKLGRGVTNVLQSPIEVFRHMKLMSEDHHWAIGGIGGAARGTLYMVVRAAVGIYETATFAVPIPADYAPIMDPVVIVPSD